MLSLMRLLRYPLSSTSSLALSASAAERTFSTHAPSGRPSLSPFLPYAESISIGSSADGASTASARSGCAEASTWRTARRYDSESHVSALSSAMARSAAERASSSARGEGEVAVNTRLGIAR